MNKKLVALVVALLTFGIISGCNNNSNSIKVDDKVNANSFSQHSSETTETDNSQNDDEFLATGDIDVDLTKLNSIMVYSQVYNMMTVPNDFIGKTIKMKGQFAVYHDEISDISYFSVIIEDATACCQQGLEFVLGNGATYPNDYPEIDNEITVQGVFETYYEGKDMYCRLKDAKLVS